MMIGADAVRQFLGCFWCTFAAASLAGDLEFLPQWYVMREEKRHLLFSLTSTNPRNNEQLPLPRAAPRARARDVVHASTKLYSCRLLFSAAIVLCRLTAFIKSAAARGKPYDSGDAAALGFWRRVDRALSVPHSWFTHYYVVVGRCAG